MSNLKKPYIHKHGTIACSIVETTPLVFKGRLYRFEYFRGHPWNIWTERKRSYFRLIDVQTGAPTAPFGWDYTMGYAYAEEDYVYAWGIAPTSAPGGWGGDTIQGWRSSDLTHWEEYGQLHLPGWQIYNTGVCKKDGVYTLLFECGAPAEEVGPHPFTFRFAQSTDLKNWTLTPTECAFQRDRYAGGPAIYTLPGDPNYYVLYLEAYKADNKYGIEFRNCIARGTDLIHWEYSPINPVLDFEPEIDRQIANPYLTPAMQELIMKADNINVSDLELCEFNGRTIMYYSWGNQHGTEFLAEASCNMPMADFLHSFFEEV